MGSPARPRVQGPHWWPLARNQDQSAACSGIAGSSSVKRASRSGDLGDQVSAVFERDLTGSRKSEAVAALLGGEVRPENARQHVGGDSRPRVADHHPHPAPLAVPTAFDPDPLLGKAGSLVHRIRGIHEQVPEHTLDLHRVGKHGGKSSPGTMLHSTPSNRAVRTASTTWCRTAFTSTRASTGSAIWASRRLRDISPTHRRLFEDASRHSSPRRPIRRAWRRAPASAPGR